MHKSPQLPSQPHACQQGPSLPCLSVAFIYVSLPTLSSLTYTTRLQSFFAPIVQLPVGMSTLFSAFLPINTFVYTEHTVGLLSTDKLSYAWTASTGS